MLLVLLQPDLLGELIQAPIHPDPDVAGLPGVLEDLLVLPLPGTDHGGENLDARPLRQLQNLVDDLVNGLLADLLAADGAVGGAHTGPEKAEVVVNLRHRAHGGAGVLAGGLLVNRDGRGEAVDVVHVRLLHLAQEHPGVGGEALHVAPLALGVDGVEGQGGLAGAGKAGDHHQLVPRDLHVHVLEVVLPGAFDIDLVLHGWLLLIAFKIACRLADTRIPEWIFYVKPPAENFPPGAERRPGGARYSPPRTRYPYWYVSCSYNIRRSFYASGRRRPRPA